MSHPKFFSSEKEYVMFYSKSADVNSRLLSNFSPNTICIDFAYLGVPHRSIATYPSGEHAFHGGKFKILSAQSTVSSARQEELLDHSRRFEGATLKDCHYTSAADAKYGGGRGGVQLTETELREWNICSMLLQEQICREKLKEPEILEYLLSTDGKYLVHHEQAPGWPRYGAVVLSAEDSPYNDGMRWMQGDNLLGEMWMTLREEILTTHPSR